MAYILRRVFKHEQYSIRFNYRLDCLRYFIGRHYAMNKDDILIALMLIGLFFIACFAPEYWG